MRWLLILVVVFLAGCGAASQRRIDTARVHVNGGAMVLMETNRFLVGVCSQRTCEGPRWERVVDALNTARHMLLAADDALRAADDPANLTTTAVCAYSAVSRALAAVEAAGVKLPLVLSGWQEQTGIPGALCNWEPDPNAYVGRGSSE